MRRPVIIPEGQRAPARTLAVDAPVLGAQAIYSHWQDGGHTPPSLKADTSTEMLVRAAHDVPRWLEPYTTVANIHVDADGLLAMACACRPDLAVRHGSLLVAAAEAGDFSAWTGEAGFRLMLTVHQLMRDAPPADDRPTTIAIAACDGLEALITESQRPEGERDAAVAQVWSAIERLRRGQDIQVEDHGSLWTIAWRCQRGHATDCFGQVFQPDDLPLWALDAVVPRHVFQATSEGHDDGWRHILEAPRHTWARTVIRPPVAWPDGHALAAALAEREPDAGWVARPAAGGIAYTALLACRRSRLTPAQFCQAVTPVLH